MRLIGLLVLLALVFLVLRIWKGGATMATRVCPRCSQRIPALGSYCPICGERIA
jgi:predicted amidophosphoribosyltransferase